ncbi:MAG: cyanophycinase, partial [Bacteroidetes bacterium]|nr:cyanophycinase [Bacteroidota bacterium]
AILIEDLTTIAGLGLISNCIIDSHFIRRGRIGRLIEATILNPALIGIGLGENTALIITEGNRMECIGSGMVMIIDSRNINKTNVHYVEEGAPIYAENIVTHVMAKGTSYLLNEHEFLADHLRKGVDLSR